VRIFTATIALCICLMTCAAQAETGVPVSVLGGLTRIYALTPGSTAEGKLILQNDSDAPSDVRLYQTDYLFYADGRALYGPPASIPRSNAAWIKVTPQQITIPANASTIVYFSIAIPQDQALSGSYWSVLMVEPLEKGALAPPEPVPGGGVQVGIRAVHRYAVQLVTNINGGSASVTMDNPQLVVDDANAQLLTIDIANTGELWLNPRVWTELFDLSGKSLGRFEGTKVRIFPGCSARYKVALPGIPPGVYSALVVADNSDEHVFGSQVPLTIP